jgi:hypothetical protein
MLICATALIFLLLLILIVLQYDGRGVGDGRV